MNLFVGNMSPEITEIELRELFSEFGEVVVAKIVRDKETGLPRGFGFVEMGDKYTAFDAIDNLDATFYKGQIISVKEAKQPNATGGRKPFNSGPKRPFNNNKRP
ncbi:MAG: RNA-binding protein [Taibaiella sp.]|nr:RNA-binding protein [Taibaiella sp.]